MATDPADDPRGDGSPVEVDEREIARCLERFLSRDESLSAGALRALLQEALAGTIVAFEPTGPEITLVVEWSPARGDGRVRDLYTVRPVPGLEGGPGLRLTYLGPMA